MEEEKYEIIPIYITKEREWYTGDRLKDIDTYQDLGLIKTYGKNIEKMFEEYPETQYLCTAEDGGICIRSAISFTFRLQ